MAYPWNNVLLLVVHLALSSQENTRLWLSDAVRRGSTPGQSYSKRPWKMKSSNLSQRVETLQCNPVGGRIKQKGRCKRAEEKEWGREREREKAGWGYYRSFKWLWNPRRAWSSSLFLFECLPPQALWLQNTYTTASAHIALELSIGTLHLILWKWISLLLIDHVNDTVCAYWSPLCKPVSCTQSVCWLNICTWMRVLVHI